MKTVDTIKIIGISGASGSGKTWLTQRLATQLGQVESFSQDSYYKVQDHIDMSDRVKTNYDHPEALDIDLFVRQLQQLIAGEPIESPIYDYSVHNRGRQTRRIEPAEYILVEGILLFTFPQVCEMMDLKIFVDTPADLCFIRRLERDTRERGRSVESVISQYMNTVRPMTQQFITPSRDVADLVVNGETMTEAQVIRLARHIQKRELSWASG